MVAVMMLGLCASYSANAFEYELGNNSLKVTGYATGGMIDPDIELPVFIGDWRVRGQLTNSSFENINSSIS